MKDAIHLFLQILIIGSVLSLFLGLYKPVLVLWFLDRFNRLKVLKVYGLSLLILVFLVIVNKII
ncbi:hypothetical protein ACFSKL_08865 [Belliella marina]|uniref:Uncharacterized protein n=1 Tax=Belliella marina TaxID=1644146 RepID=A0ABW4VJM4_9BACT